MLAAAGTVAWDFKSPASANSATGPVCVSTGLYGGEPALQPALAAKGRSDFPPLFESPRDLDNPCFAPENAEENAKLNSLIAARSVPTAFIPLRAGETLLLAVNSQKLKELRAHLTIDGASIDVTYSPTLESMDKELMSVTVC